MSLLHQQNTKLVVFDFDGTIADTSEGILDSHRFTLEKLQIKIPNESDLRSFIGGSLLRIYMDKFHLIENKARKAVSIYRKRYETVGIYKAFLYEGFIELLQQLKKNSIKVGIATLKVEKFAKIMTEELGINTYFDSICGMDSKDSYDKASLVLRCCQLCNVTKDNVILIGDSDSDFQGAQKAGVSFIGVTYGFGFNNGDNVSFPLVKKPLDILSYL